MTTWFITRHPGALKWADHTGLAFDCHCTHLDPAGVQPGDTVIGTLPVHLAAAVCRQGVRYLHLSLDISASGRGRELDADQLAACHPRLESYAVTLLPTEETAS